MKSSTVFLILGILIVSVGLAWIVSGGLAGHTGDTVSQTPVRTAVPSTLAQVQTTVTDIVTTEAVPITEAPVTPAATGSPTVATPQVTTTAPVSGDDVTNHFLDIAYRSTNRLERLNYESGKARVVISAISASNDDIALIEKTVLDFNDASRTVKLSENVKDTGSGDIVIKFLTEDGLSAINLAEAPASATLSENLTNGELYQGSTLAAKIMRGTIYINADLKQEARRHILVKSLMYQMGLTGETTKYPDSVFSATENTNVDFTPVDKKAIAILYEPGLYNGMTMDQIRNIIYIP
jgi:hypothetical protein